MSDGSQDRPHGPAPTIEAAAARVLGPALRTGQSPFEDDLYTWTPEVAEELARRRQRRFEKIGRWALPLMIMVTAIWLWDRICVWNDIPHFILPRPGVVLETLVDDAGLLFSSLWVTLKITFLSLLLAVAGGVGLAIGGSAALLTALVILGIRDEDSFPLIFYRENCADMALCEDDIDEGLIAETRSVLATGTHLSNPRTEAAVIRALKAPL